jgi:hypothetical protein
LPLWRVYVGTRKFKPEQRLPGRDPGELLFRSLASVGKKAGTHADWIWEVVSKIKILAGNLAEFTVDDLRSFIRGRLAEPDDARAYGTAFREAVRLGHIRNSGRVVMGERRENVGTPRPRPVTVWESLL